MIYLISILFTICFIFYSKYQFINGRAGEWHIFGMLMRIITFIPFFLPKQQLQDIFLAGVINIILFDIGINIIALKQKWNYTGTTSKFDKIGKTKFLIYTILLVIALILKIII